MVRQRRGGERRPAGWRGTRGGDERLFTEIDPAALYTGADSVLAATAALRPEASEAASGRQGPADRAPPRGGGEEVGHVQRWVVGPSDNRSWGISPPVAFILIK